MSELTWSAIESNPEVLNRFLRYLGVSKEWGFVDILSFDSEYLSFISRPVIAILFLFPVENNKNCPFELDASKIDTSKNSVYFLKQSIFNACGTIALIHALANNTIHLNLDPESVIGKFIDETRKMTVEERSNYLKQNEAINKAHEATAWYEGTERPSWLKDSVCCHHYITLLQVDSKLYQLDGLKEYPISHGSTTEDTFLSDAAKICLEYIKKDPSNIKFNAMALVKIS